MTQYRIAVRCDHCDARNSLSMTVEREGGPTETKKLIDAYSPSRQADAL
jgi:hypothetical protein